jgi:hypothetical protein
MTLAMNNNNMRKNINSNSIVQQAKASEDKQIEQQKDDKIMQELEYEIECPRCYDIMTLSSQFDSLCYICDSCDFALFTIKKDSGIDW